MSVVRTTRLTLVACTEEIYEAMMHDRERLAVLAGAPAHPEWPGDELAGALPLMLAALRGDESLFGWQAWLVLHEGRICGDVGAHGRPGGDGEMEIGFSIVPAMRGRGLAKEAVGAFIANAVERGGVARVVARVRPDNDPSKRVLASLGFEHRGRDEDHLRYELSP